MQQNDGLVNGCGNQLVLSAAAAAAGHVRVAAKAFAAAACAAACAAAAACAFSMPSRISGSLSAKTRCISCASA